MGKAHCHKCGVSHNRPVGKRCLREQSIAESEAGVAGSSTQSSSDEMLQLLRDIKSNQQQMEDRISRLEDSRSIASDTILSDGQAPSTREDVIPSMAALKSSPEVQREVAKRLRDLESRGNTSGKSFSSAKLKSGRFRGADAPVVNHVTWPQEFIYAGPNRRTVDYTTSPLFSLLRDSCPRYSFNSRVALWTA